MKEIDYLIQEISEANLEKLALKLRPYLDRMTLTNHKIWGDPARLHLGEVYQLNDTLFNTARGHIYIGDYTFFGHGALVLTGRHPTDQVDSARMHIPAGEGRDIVIGRGVWIASGAIIIGPCRIGDDAVIAAGSVVRHDVPDGWLYAGNPARPIRQVVDARQHPHAEPPP